METATVPAEFLFSEKSIFSVKSLYCGLAVGARCGVNNTSPHERLRNQDGDRERGPEVSREKSVDDASKAKQAGAVCLASSLPGFGLS